MFTKDMQVFEYAKSYIYTIMPIFIFYSIMFVCNGVINGAGKTIVIMVFTTSTTLVLRTILAFIQNMSQYFLGKSINVIFSI